jgi:micrococcal nuclease
MFHKGITSYRFTKLAISTILALLLALFLALPVTAQSEAPWTGVVDKVIDGDSLIVTSGGKEIEVRLYGIDAPEWRQPYGKEAVNFMKTKAPPGTQVKIYPKGKDSHGRVLGRVFVEKKELNEIIIRAGMAWWYARYAPLMTNYYEAQKEAKKFSRGLWIDADPMPPWLWRKKHKK